jgi:hypothetical protein
VTSDNQQDARARTREIAREVLIEAFGASATPFVPVPFVDDYLYARLLRRVATKVLDRNGLPSSDSRLPRTIVDAFLKEGASPIGTSIAVGAARFIVRKVAIVLDVKKCHEVFGESIAFAVALDIGASRGWAREASAERLGGAMHRSLKAVGSGAFEALFRAGREAAKAGGNPARMGDAIGREIDEMRAKIEPLMARELPPT